MGLQVCGDVHLWTADMGAIMPPPVALWRVFPGGNYAIMG
jgi:hypothetical protein